ncbi:DUF2500 domain-containing protein [Cohnella yongneupensis]|uniref:DUF2500 domain-containing protein n=1 Tax=Cohnella yongneupensis TaxID=425006 RepID=A0ABW0QUR6_9BACL
MLLVDQFGESQGFFAGMPLFFKLFGGFVVLAIAGTIIFVIVKGVGTWSSNNASPVVQARCKVIDKRTEVWGGSGDSSASTNYYITFEFEDGNRVELPIRSNQFGLIAQGDQGELTYQGTRFKGFNRTIM